ncbi:MAG: hypothetical protein JXR03_04080 [Cyclobacteriaceae bacterium]
MPKAKSITPSIPTFKFDSEFREAIGKERIGNGLTYIILDDDPTGGQTVYDIPVITTWGVDEICAELEKGTSVFFILTNSRSMPAAKAGTLLKLIGENIRKASDRTKRQINVISRGDSTLRGHYPLEMTAFDDGFGESKDLNILIPAFFEGGRYTIDDVHYLTDNSRLVPVGETSFAQDKAFGYRSSNLIDWVEEKYEGGIAKSNIKSISLTELNSGDSHSLIDRLKQFDSSDVIAVNASNYKELDFFTICLLRSKKSFSVRCSASFVSSLYGKKPISNLVRKDLISSDGKGGLLVIGSYVPKTTSQLDYLLDNADVSVIELEVNRILSSESDSYRVEVQEKLKLLLQEDRDVVVYTSRILQSGADAESSLNIGSSVSAFVVSLVSSLEVKPRFVLAKGGITSSDIATKSLRIKRALIQGQVLSGVPVWKTGQESKFPNISYIIFPGNVGSESALWDVYQKLKSTAL